MFWTIFFLLHTTFLTNMMGMGTGVWQSLGYWIAHRGGARRAAWYYYLMQLSLYEFPALLLRMAPVIAYVIKRGPQTWLAPPSSSWPLLRSLPPSSTPSLTARPSTSR